MLMVDDWYGRLGLEQVIGLLKSKGIGLDALVRGMIAYKLPERSGRVGLEAHSEATHA